MKNLICLLILFPSIVSGDSSLTFVGNGTNRVNLGSASDVDSLSAGTVIAWVYPTASATTQGRAIWSKYNNASTGWELYRESGTLDTYRCYVRRTTSRGEAVAASTVIDNQWQCVACTWDINVAALTPVLYWGDQDTAAYDINTSSVVGSGAISNDSALDLFVGNKIAAGPAAWVGQIGYVGLANRRYSQAEIQNWCANTSMAVTTNTMVSMNLGYNGTGTQYDLTGKGHNGTVTGAVVSSNGPPVSLPGGPL